MDDDEYFLFKSRTRRMMSLVSSSRNKGVLEDVLDTDEVDQPRSCTYTELSPVKFSNVTISSDEIDHQPNSTSTDTIQDDLQAKNAANISVMDPYTSAEVLVQEGNLDFQAEETVNTISTGVSQVGDLNLFTVDASEITETNQTSDLDFHETANTGNIEINQFSSFEVSIQDGDIDFQEEETVNTTSTGVSQVGDLNFLTMDASEITETNQTSDLGFHETANTENIEINQFSSFEVSIQDGDIDFQEEETVNTTSTGVSQVGDLNFLTMDASEITETNQTSDLDFHETANTENIEINQFSSFEVSIQDGDIDFQEEETVNTTSTGVSQVGDLNFFTVDVSAITETNQTSDLDFHETAKTEHIEINQCSSIEVSIQKDISKLNSRVEASVKNGTFNMKEPFINDYHKDEIFIASDGDNDDDDKDYSPPRSDENSEDSAVEELSKKRRSIVTEVHDNLDIARIPIDGEDKIKKRSRWTKEDKNMWQREKNKSLRDSCLPYKDYKGNLKAKKPQKIDCAKCIYKCNEIFNEDERIRLCKKYWSLSIFERKKDFILINVTSSEPKSRRPRINNGCARSNVKQYHFYKNDIKFRVCQAFFTKTLCISNRAIISAFSGKDEQGYYASKDKRGKKSPPNKTPDNIIQKVKSHIESFPSVESHYVRKSSKRQYLDKKLSISKMYALYVEQCKEDGDSEREIVSEITYRRTFCNNYNYSFFHPKKDQCILCTRYEASTVDQKANLEHEYNEHRRRHLEAQEEKRRDKERANSDNTFMSVTFDLQSVLQLPSCDISLAYYKRKLNAFNFTIYEASAPNNGLCFFWTEIDGHRGSSEIGTCLLKYIEKLPDNIKHLTLFSDTCGGQNRNLHVAALLLNAVQIFNVDIIEQKFLESGHSFMEVDSMHSSIESKKKFMPIYCVNDYINIFKLARARRSKGNKPPYKTFQLSFNDFIDLKNLSDQLIKNKNVDEDGKKINWLKVKCFKYEKSAPNILQYKYNYSDDYARINICARRPGRRSTSMYKGVDELEKLYKTPISISKQKKADLRELCRRGVIPEIFHAWYDSLPTSDTAKEVPIDLLTSDNEEEL